MSFVPLYKIQRRPPCPADKLLLLDRKGRVYLQQNNDGQLTLPTADLFPELQALELPELGSLRNCSCLGCRWDYDEIAADNLTVLDVREVITQVDQAHRNLLLRGKPLLEWLYSRKFCSVCGCELMDNEQEEARSCPNCQALFFPKISPAVIVLIKRDDGRILLAYNRKFRSKVYSLIAGFVEVGESAEDAVRREVREEVGLEIKNLTYQCSQSWPFPDSLMLGFTAEYASGKVTPDGEEIVEAGFYDPEQLPPLPGHGSIARKMIENYLSEYKK